jgi:hypothetical protein
MYTNPAPFIGGLAALSLLALSLIGIFPWSDCQFHTIGDNAQPVGGMAGWNEWIYISDDRTTHAWSEKKALEMNPLVWRGLFIVPICLSAALVAYIVFGHYCYAVKWHEAKSSQTLLGVACLFTIIQAALCCLCLTAWNVNFPDAWRLSLAADFKPVDASTIFITPSSPWIIGQGVAAILALVAIILFILYCKDKNKGYAAL